MPCLSPIGLSGLGALGPHRPRPCSPNSHLFSHLSVWALSLPFLRICLHRLFGLQVPFGPSFTSGSHCFVPQSPICRGHLFVLQFPILFGPSVGRAFRGLGVPLCSRLPDLAASSLCCCFAVSGSPRPLCPPQTLSLPPAPQAAGGSLPVLLVFRFLHCLPPCLQTPLLTAHPFAVRKRAGCRQFGREGWSQLQKTPFLASAIGQALEADLASSSSKAVASIW